MTQKCRTFEESTIKHLKNDPEAAEAYIQHAIEMFEEDNNSKAFLRSLRRYIEAKGGISQFTKRATTSYQDWDVVLSEDETPTIDTLRKLLNFLRDKIHFRMK